MIKTCLELNFAALLGLVASLFNYSMSWKEKETGKIK